MTKKPSEKNKAWEKERRDRLNKSFDSLAKLLPNYDPSIVWTKIEIIQKSILYIEVLQQRNKKYLAKKDPQELKKYNELIDAIKYFQLRNGQLSELLRKSKISLPPFNLPKYLSDNTNLIENNYSEQNEINNSDIKSETLINENPKEINKNSKEENFEKNVPVIRKAESTNNKKILKTSKIKSIKGNKKLDDFKAKAVRTVTVTSTVKPDVLVAEEVKFQNDIPLTDTDKIPSSNQSNILLPSNSFVPSNIQTTILPTLIKIENLPLNKKLKNSNPNQINRKLAKDQNGKIKILPQPHLKLYYRRADGKMPIPVIRKKIIVPIKKRKSCKRKLISIKNNENCHAKKIKLKTENVKAENVNENVNCESKIDKVKILDIKTTNLNLLNVDKNSGTVSPTAAFLESFPVVASTTNSGKLCDTQNNIGQVEVNPKICETTAENAENLENLNNFFATKEYSNYCAQATEIISKDSINKLNDKKLENSKVELIKSPSKLRKTEIKILENIKIEPNLPSVHAKEIIKTDNPILNENKTNSSLIPQVSTINISISNTNSILTTFPEITTANSLNLQSIAYSSPSSTLNLINYISPPATTIFTPSTQFLSNYPDFSNSTVRKSNVRRNSCKFNLSTKGPICTPLPLDSKNFITQNYSASTNCKITSSNITTLLPQTTIDNFNISKTGNSAMNYGPMVITTNSLFTTNTMPGQNISKMFINDSTTTVPTAENTASIFPYTTNSAELQSNNTSLPLVSSSKNIANYQNYQTSFENFNLKTYSAATNVTPETSKKSADKTTKISTKNSKSLLNIVSCTTTNSIIPSTYTSTYSSSVSISSTNSNMSNSANLYQGISTLNQSFVNNNSTISQTCSGNLIPTTSISDSTCNLNYSKPIKESINSVGYTVKNVDTNLQPPQFNPYSMTCNSTNSLNTSIQSNTIDVKYSLNNFVPPAISTNTISSLTYSYCTNSSIPTDVKSQSIKFHPYAANFGIPMTTTAVNISTNLIPTYSTTTVNAMSNYPTTKSIMNCVSTKNPIIPSTNVTYTTAYPITMSTKSSNTAKHTNSNLISPYLHTKSTDNTNYQPFTSSLPSNVMPSSSTNTPITTSQFLLRPYDFVANTTTSIINSATVPSSYLPSIPYTTTTTTTTKQTILPSNYIFSTCNSSGSNYSHPIFTNLSTTIDNNNYSAANSVYSNPSKNYYYPLKQSETSTTFSFSLTTTTNSQTTPLITPQTQPPSVLTYPNLKSELPPPWLPTPAPPTSATITTDFKTPFTFSLTPTTTAILTTTTSKSSAPSITSTASNNFILKNPQIPLNSYNSTTNFTFCLTTPKSTIPLDGGRGSNKSKNYQTNYPIYNSTAFVDTQLNFNQKDTTNFTFALTKSTNSVTDITPNPSTTIIPNNNKFDNLYTNNASNQEIRLQNTIPTTVAGQFKNTSTTNKVKNGNTPKLNKKNISQISNNIEQNYYDCEQNKSCAKVNQKSHVNWMTSSSSENTTISKITPPQQYYSAQNNESILPWSPNKIYDNNLQQTYYGSEITNHYSEFPTQNLNQNLKFYNNIVKNEKYIETIPPTSSIINNQSSNNNNNFFSVSQLVDQSSVSSKNFTNSSIQNFHQTSCQHSKISPTKSRTTIIKDIKIENQTNNLLNLDYSEREEQKPLTISNTYSAEALISKKEKHRNFNPTNCNNNNNNGITNPTDFCSSSIDQLDTIISDQNNYHTNNYFYNYHHHQQSINHHQNYTIQSEIDYLGGNNINASYENDEYNKTLNKIDKKLYPPSSYPPPIPPVPPPPPTSSLPTSNSFNTNVTTYLPYETNFGHMQYYHGSTTTTKTTTTTTTATSSSANNNNNYHHHHQPSNWTKGLQYTNSSCIIPQYHHSQQILPPILGEHQHQHGQQSTINSQTVTGNLTNFNLSSICPEINDKVNSSGRNNEW